MSHRKVVRMMKEKANKTSAVPHKVKGAVLFTVVCVMMVLIVFLMGTLALAATANKRAMTNYQQEQTEYTARAVLEAVLNKANDPNESLREDIGNISSTSTPLSIAVNIPNDTAQEVSNVTISDTGRTQTVFNAADGQWQQIPVYQMQVTVSSQTTSASTTYEALISAANAVASTTTVITTGGGAGGAFVSLGDVTTDIGTGGYITGGTFIGLDNKDATPPIIRDYTVGASADTMMDAPIYVYGNLTSAVHKYTVHFKRPGDFFAVEGNFAVTHDTGFGTTYDGFSWDTSLAEQDYNEIPKIYVGGTFNMTDRPVRIGSDAVPTNVFCGNFLFNCTNDSNLENIHGDIYAFEPDGVSELSSINNNHTELYAWADSTITVKEGTDEKHFGNILSAGSLKLHAYNNGQVLEVGGSIRVDKDVTIDGGKTCKVGSTVNGHNIKGDVVVGGTLTIDAGTTLECTGDIICGTLVNNGTIICAGEIKAVNHPTDGNLNGKTVTEVTAPFAGAGATDTVVTYYEVTGNQTLDWGDWHVKLNYRKHVSVNGGAETVTDVHDWEPAGEFVVTKAECPDLVDVDAYLRANNAVYNDIMTYNSLATAKTETIVNNFYDFQSIYGEDVYPDKYAKTKEISPGNFVSNMPEQLFTSTDPTTGNPVVNIPQASNYTTKYITTVAGLGSSIYQDGGALVDTNGNVIVSDYHGYAPSIKVYGSGAKYYRSEANNAANLADIVKTDSANKQYYEVSSSCVLSGFIDKNVYIKTSNGASPSALTVVLDNVSMDFNSRASIIIDDAAQVTLFVVGSLNCGTLITEDYLNLTMGAGNYTLGGQVHEAFNHMANDLDIKQVAVNESDPTYPNVLLYAENSGDPANPTSLNLRDTKELITAIVRAPYMSFNQRQTADVNKTIFYYPTNGTNYIKYGSNASYGECGSVGVIGELVAKQINMQGADKWGLIYVTLPAGAGGSGGSGGSTTIITTPGTSEYFDFMYFNVT